MSTRTPNLPEYIEKRRAQLEEQAREVAARLQAQVERLRNAKTLEQLAAVDEVHMRTPAMIAARASELLTLYHAIVESAPKRGGS